MCRRTQGNNSLREKQKGQANVKYYGCRIGLEIKQQKKNIFLYKFKSKYVNRENKFCQIKDILHPL